MIPIVKPFLPKREDLIPRLEKIIYSGYIAEGVATVSFENKLSELIGNPYCLALNSGTAALHIALTILGITQNDEVISTPLTAEPTNTTIALTGAKVVFADVEIETGLISPDSIEERITERTKAIIVVHYAGMVCDMDRINAISEKYNIPVIEDAAHAFLAMYNGKYLGSNSRFSCFSFQAIKHLTTIDGGLLCLSSEQDFIRAKKMRWFGLDKQIPRLENDITEAGFKYHMNNVNATIGLVQLEYLEENVMQYVNNGQFFDEHLKFVSGVKLIPYHNNTMSSYWLYTMKVERRADFIEMMASNGITASPLHLRNDRHSVFKSKNLNLPNLDSFYEDFVHIPCGWWLSREDRQRIVYLIQKGW